MSSIIYFPGPRSWTAHPQYDRDGNYYNCSTAYTNGVYQIVKIPNKMKENEATNEGIEIISSLPYQKAPAYYHSFAMTENYFVFIESSLFLAHPLKMLLMKIMNWTYVDMFYFESNVKSRLHLVERKSGKVAGVFSTEAFMCFHQINAYEKENELVFDMCGYNDASIMQTLYLQSLRGEKKAGKMAIPEIRRYRLPLGKISPENPVHMELEKDANGRDYESIRMGVELPRINYEKYNGREYSFVYGIAPSQQYEGSTGVSKVRAR